MDTFYAVCPPSHFYEISSLIREYYPLVRVPEVKTEGAPGVVFSSDESSVCLYDAQGCAVRAEKAKDLPSFDYLSDPAKNRAKVMLTHLLGGALPWGILTGVRPTKIAYTYLDQGLSPQKIEEKLQEGYLLRADKARLCAQVALRERQILEDHDGSDVSVYVNIPFCPTRCLYCSFISCDERSYQKYHEAYVQTLLKELASAKDLLKGRRIRSFYMGGGTPTTLSVQELSKILQAADDLCGLRSLDEVTVEAGRPDTITEEKLRVMKEAGVTRLSVNPQTMVQSTLDRIGRAHTVRQTIDAYCLARKSGPFIINMDIILGLPGEDADDVKTTLSSLQTLGPDNLTVHTLAVKRSSRLHELGLSGQVLPEDVVKTQKDMEEKLFLASEAARQMGLEPYYLYRQKNMAGNFENVGYARPGSEGRYNVEIMEERQNIVAFGAGGVSKFYDPKTNHLSRAANVKGVPEYIERIDLMIRRKEEEAGLA